MDWEGLCGSDEGLFCDQGEDDSSPNARIRLKESDMAKTRGIPSVNASGREFSHLPGQSHGRCRVCRRRFELYRGYQRFCSSRCRLMAWSVRELNKRLSEGTIEGLRNRLKKLGESA